MARRKLSTVEWVRVKEIYQKCARLSKFERKTFLEHVAEESPEIAEEAAFLLEQAGSAVSPKEEAPAPPSFGSAPTFVPSPPSGPMAPNRIIELPLENRRVELASRRRNENRGHGEYVKFIFVAFLIGVFVGGAMLLYPKWKKQRDAASIETDAIGIDQ